MGDSLNTIAEVFEYILHPYESLMMLVNWIIGYIPAVCMIFIIFYAATGSKKILKVMGFIILCYVLIEMAFAYHVEGLILIVLIAIILLKFFGGSL